jgi:hypothetical protein
MMNIPSSAIYGRDIHRGNVFGLSARLITDTTTTVTKELHFVLLVIIIPGIHRLQSALSMDPPSYYSLETNTILNEFVSTVVITTIIAHIFLGSHRDHSAQKARKRA